MDILSDIILPARVIAAAGLQGRAMRRNTRTRGENGTPAVNSLWDHSLREFNLGIIPMHLDVWREVRGVFEATDAGAKGFLIQDPSDPDAVLGEGKLQSFVAGVAQGAAGEGVGLPTLYALKRYAAIDSPLYVDRPVARLGSVTVYRNGSPVTPGAGAGQVSVDPGTGRVTFVADVTQSVGSTAIGATTELTFSLSSGVYAAASVGDRVYLSGVTGTAASVLNGKAHEVTAKSGASPYTLTLAVNTTGLTVNDSGTAALYPQENDALEWAGDFFLAVQFASDDLNWELMKPGENGDRLVAGRDVVLIEIPEFPQ